VKTDILAWGIWIFAPFWDRPLADFRCIAVFRSCVAVWYIIHTHKQH